MKKFLILALFVTLFTLGITQASAQEQARDITPGTTIYGSGYDSFWFLTDDDMTGRWAAINTSFTIESPEAIGSIYLMLDYNHGTYSITDPDTGTTVKFRQDYLHQYVDLIQLLGYAPNKVQFTFYNSWVMISELEVYSPGEPPAHVQRWQAPWDYKTDILLFCSHGDDDHLYFAGLLPLYAGEKKYNVQVVYMTDHHNDNYVRRHEMLNGLWTVGVRAYPIFGRFADFLSYDMNTAYKIYEEEYETTREALQEFVVEQLRRFRPQVVVGHDIYGEYGHAMHKIYTDLLISAIPLVEDRDSFPDSADRWGTWKIPKVYLHLYWGNRIVMDYDQPLSNFDGMTAFQVSQKLGFPCHQSQQFRQFVTWINGYNDEITSATQIENYNPAKYGLYYTRVGNDELKNDMMEHITPHAYTRRKTVAEAMFLAYEPPAQEEYTPVDPFDHSQPVEKPVKPDVPVLPLTPSTNRSLWIDLGANALILAAATTVVVVGIVRLKKKKKEN